MTVEHIDGAAVSSLGTEWDDFVSSAPGGEVNQTSTWGRVRARAGFEPRLVAVRHDGRIVAGAQVLLRRLPIGSVGYVPYGPLVTPDAPDAAIDAVIDGMNGVAKRVVVLFVQPALGGERVVARLRANGYRASEARVAPVATARVDLRVDEATLLSRLSRTNRRLTRRWPEMGVTVRHGTVDDISTFADLHALTAQRHGFEPISADYLALLLGQLGPEGKAALLLGEVEGTAVAGAFISTCGDVATERLVGFALDDESRRCRVPAAVTWAGIQWARDRGLGWYDVGGLELRTARMLLDEGQAATSAAAEGPEQAKLAWGACAVIYPPAVERFSGAISRSGYDALLRAAAGRRLIDHLRHRLRRG